MIVALAYREYETWSLTAAQSLHGLHGLPNDLDPPKSPEAIRDAKGWLGAGMEFGYAPVIHQAQLTRKFDLDQAGANASFDHFFQRICAFLEGSA